MTGKGKITQVLGPVLDVEFTDYLPEINEALETTFTVDGKEHNLVLEVAAQLGDKRVRTIAMDMTEGCVRGQEVVATGSPIKVPVGEEVLGRIPAGSFSCPGTIPRPITTNPLSDTNNPLPPSPTSISDLITASVIPRQCRTDSVVRPPNSAKVGNFPAHNIAFVHAVRLTVSRWKNSSVDIPALCASCR